MAGLTAQGFEIKRSNTILEDLNTRLRLNLKRDIDTSEGSVAGIINAIVADELASLWELAQGIYDGSDILKAEGVQLEDLALRVGLTRFPAQRTRGVAWFTGENGASIPTTARLSSLRGDEFRPESNFNISTTTAISLNANVEVVNNSTEYQITVNSTIYTFTSDSDATKAEITAGLNTALQAGASTFTSSVVDEQIQIVATDSSQTLNVGASSFITFNTVVTPSIVVSTQFGFIPGDSFTLVNIDTPINGWNSVTNNDDLNLGRNPETDNELRVRIIREFATTGSGTFISIIQAMLRIDNVQAAIIHSNRTWVTDTSVIPNLPPKSYAVVVHDGLTQDILNEVFRTQPAGIEAVGNTTGTVTDPWGQTHTVKFSRPTSQYAYMRITRTTHNEESYPTDGDDRIKQACLIYGDTLSIGQDVSPKRFFGPIYGGVAGIDDLTVEIALSTDNTLPNNDVSLTYVETKLPISNSEISRFAISRMEVV